MPTSRRRGGTSAGPPSPINPLSPGDRSVLLVIHGSRDPRPQRLAAEVAAELARRLGLATGRVGVAQLEFAARSLAAQIVAFAEDGVGAGEREMGRQDAHPTGSLGWTGEADERVIERVIEIVPLFLGAGVHAMEDVPAQVAEAAEGLGSRVHVHLHPPLGRLPGWPDWLRRQWQQGLTAEPAARKILLAHGSRRAGGNAEIEQLAAAVGAEVAYWSIAPQLADRLAPWPPARPLAAPIHIWPYFLFAGGLTEAIATQVAQFNAQYNQALPPSPDNGGLWLGETIVPGLPLAEFLAAILDPERSSGERSSGEE